MQQTVLGFTTHSVQHHRLNKLQSYSLPSNSFINLTLGASGTEYVAPADGWFSVAGSSNGNDGQIWLESSFLKSMVMGNPHIAIANFIPCCKGKKTKISYYNYSCEYFRFIYANGSQPA